MEMNGNARALRHKWGVVIQESRVYMLCTVAQVFRARGGRPIVLFASPFSGGGGGKQLRIYSQSIMQKLFI